MEQRDLISHGFRIRQGETKVLPEKVVDCVQRGVEYSCTGGCISGRDKRKINAVRNLWKWCKLVTYNTGSLSNIRLDQIIQEFKNTNKKAPSGCV